MSLYLGSHLVVPTVEGDGTSSAPVLQTKTGINPSTSSQLITFDSGYDGLESVQINAMSTITPPSAMSSTSSGVYRATLSPGSSVQYLNIPVGYNNTALYYTIPAGGASNLITGTFTTSSTTGSIQTVNIPYTGTGYPIMVFLEVSPDMYNTSTTWSSTIQRYAIGMASVVKPYNSTPTYGTSGTENYGHIYTRYKSSTSSATSYTNSGSSTINFYSSSKPSASNTLFMRFSDAKTMKVYVAGTSYGLMASTLYKYAVAYSS